MSFLILTQGSEFNASHLMSNFRHVREGHMLPLSGDYLQPTTGVYDIGSATYIFSSVSCEYLNLYSTMNFITQEYGHETISSVMVGDNGVFTGTTMTPVYGFIYNEQNSNIGSQYTTTVAGSVGVYCGKYIYHRLRNYYTHTASDNFNLNDFSKSKLCCYAVQVSYVKNSTTIEFLSNRSVLQVTSGSIQMSGGIGTSTAYVFLDHELGYSSSLTGLREHFWYIEYMGGNV